MLSRRVQSAVNASTKATVQWTCPRCAYAQRIQPKHAQPKRIPTSPARPFTASAAASKNADKRAASNDASSKPSSRGATEASGAASDELTDFSALEAQILKAIERLTHKLSELRAGGRFNPAILDNLTVTVDKDSKATARLSDIAQIIPRGRNVSVIVAEDVYVKPVAAAILASPHSLNPQGPTREAPTTLTITVPPPTGESRNKTVEEANRFAEEASAAVKAARQTHHKKLRAMELGKKARPDDLQRAQRRMEEVVKKGQDEVKSIADSAKKVLQSS